MTMSSAQLWLSPRNYHVLRDSWQSLSLLLLFGNRLPASMRSLGQGVTEFKKGLEGLPKTTSNEGRPKKLDDQPVKS